MLSVLSIEKRKSCKCFCPLRCIRMTKSLVISYCPWLIGSTIDLNCIWITFLEQKDIDSNNSSNSVLRLALLEMIINLVHVRWSQIRVSWEIVMKHCLFYLSLSTKNYLMQNLHQKCCDSAISITLDQQIDVHWNFYLTIYSISKISFQFVDSSTI